MVRISRVVAPPPAVNSAASFPNIKWAKIVEAFTGVKFNHLPITKAHQFTTDGLEELATKGKFDDQFNFIGELSKNPKLHIKNPKAVLATLKTMAEDAKAGVDALLELANKEAAAKAAKASKSGKASAAAKAPAKPLETIRNPCTVLGRKGPMLVELVQGDGVNELIVRVKKQVAEDAEHFSRLNFDGLALKVESAIKKTKDYVIATQFKKTAKQAWEAARKKAEVEVTARPKPSAKAKVDLDEPTMDDLQTKYFAETVRGYFSPKKMKGALGTPPPDREAAVVVKNYLSASGAGKFIDPDAMAKEIGDSDNMIAEFSYRTGDSDMQIKGVKVAAPLPTKLK